MSNSERKVDKKQKTYFGFHPNIFFTGIVSFLTDTSIKMVYSVMPMFLLSIGASKTSISLIEGIAESTASLIKTFSGYWSDKIGKNKPFLFIGYGISTFIIPLYSFVISPVQVLYLRFIERVGKGIRTAPRDSLVAGSVENGQTGKSFGLHKAMDNSGAILGPLLAFVLLMYFPGNFRLVFLLAAIPAFLGIFAVAFGIKEAKKDNKYLLKQFRFSDFPKKYYLFLAIVFIFTLGNSTDALLMIKANEVGVKVTFIPLVYLIANVVSVLFSIPIGSFSDKIGRERILIIGYLIYAIVYYGFGVTGKVSVIVALFALYGFYSASTDGIQKAFVSDLIGKNKKGTGLGIYNALLGITLLPASIIAGWLYDKINSHVPFYFGASTALLSAVLMVIFLMINKEKRISVE
ncbi:Major facilitator superfamily permease [uncultured Paludibacter sp.]|nr:Major facilitator superfamily permease [uncultured Paludibacter sp.]